MSDSGTHNSTYCSDQVRRFDEDRWLAASYAPAPLRRALLALYAFQTELRRIPAAVTEPALGEIRLQWWRDAFDELRNGKSPRAHPVVDEISATANALDTHANLIEAAIDAAARPLYGEGFSQMPSLVSWLEQADGTFDALAVRIAGGDAALSLAAAKAGGAFALAREGRALAPSLESEIAAQASALYREVAPSLKSAPAEVSPALLHLSLTSIYAQRGAQHFPVRKRMRLFSAMAFGRF